MSAMDGLIKYSAHIFEALLKVFDGFPLIIHLDQLGLVFY